MGSYPKKKGRSDRKSGFLGIPKDVARHPNFKRLSGWATKCLILLLEQYNGHNNGDLSATWLQAKAFGFNSEATLSRAKEELLHYRLITNVRPGGKNKPTLYALTWKEIDECNGKLDVSSTKTPPGDWKEEQPYYISKHHQKKK